MNKEVILAEAKTLFDQARAHRRHIHKHPELSFHEERTADYVASVLDAEGISYSRIADTGILAKIEGRGELKRAIVLRADMDALPVREADSHEVVSANEGVMHACGHDMHTAALLGAMKIINRHKDELRGTLFGLFQPGEELCPGGASLVLKEKPFEGYDVAAVVGEHVDPDLPTGAFGFRAGKYMASSDEIRITIHGEGGHAAMPQKLKDPVVAAAAVITALQQIVSRNDNPGMPTVLSIGRVIADGATNIIPDRVYMEGTFRTFDETWRREGKSRIREVAESTAAAYGVRAEVNINDGYPCVVNSEELTDAIRKSTADMFGEKAVVALDMRPTAEDFGFYTQVYPSLFYRFGVGGSRTDVEAGKVGRLHSPAFDPDEAALEYAVAGLVNAVFSL